MAELRLARMLAPLALLLAGACATTAPRPDVQTASAASTTSTTTLTAPDGRVIDLTIIAPASPRGVILFSHGGGSAPLSTTRLHTRLAERGFAVLVPTHTDSLTLPKERRTGLEAAFFTRIADLKATAKYASQAYPALPVAQVGYSYGSLASLIGGGAFQSFIPGTNPATRAVVMFSSPGPIAQLTLAPGAFDAVKVPTLLVTGDADVVQGFADDPAKHLVYFDALPAGDRTALIVAGGTHAFPKGEEPGWDEAAAIVDDFLAGRVLGDAAASKRFEAAATSERVTIKRR